ncbi:plasmid recombination protein [Staphylococcus epidermidis]|nr:plasmid recombination protein [Staphylococcus epidermidis]
MNFLKIKRLKKQSSFLKHAKTFLEQEYGKDNLLYATVHMDEKTPHMHYGVVPITEDGRLSAKEVLGNKKALTEFQDRFNEHINSCGYDLSRGITRALHRDDMSR